MGGKESRVGAAGADFQFYAAATSGAVADVRGLLAIDVDSRVDVAAIEMHADVTPRSGVFGPALGVGRVAAALRRRVAGKVEEIAGHGELRMMNDER